MGLGFDLVETGDMPEGVDDGFDQGVAQGEG